MITSAVPFSQEFQKYTQFDGFNEFLKDLRESIIKKTIRAYRYLHYHV